jgi:hypothetical protein
MKVADSLLRAIGRTFCYCKASHWGSPSAVSKFAVLLLHHQVALTFLLQILRQQSVKLNDGTRPLRASWRSGNILRGDNRFISDRCRSSCVNRSKSSPSTSTRRHHSGRAVPQVVSCRPLIQCRAVAHAVSCRPLIQCRAMAQAVICRPLTAKAWLHSRTSPRGVCVWQ